MAVVHISRRTGLSYPDGLFYAINPSYRKKSVLPINRNECEVVYRCMKGNKKCKAKATGRFISNLAYHDNVKACKMQKRYGSRKSSFGSDQNP